jgi:hypothetical protein
MSQSQRQCSPELELLAKPSRRIILPIEQIKYQAIVVDRVSFRAWLDMMYTEFPELFPEAFAEGYHLHDLRQSSKLPEVSIRRIRLPRTGEVFRVVPSFVLPYMTGYTADVEKALFLRRFGVPFWGLTYVFGRNDMYWQRMVAQLGRYDLVGTTVKDADLLPEHLLADEKFTSLNGKRMFVATTVGADVILGAATSSTAQTTDLTEAYGEFRTEALRLKSDYQPETVNTDGWKQTKLAWQNLFPLIFVIRCFLHAYMRIRDRCKSTPVFTEIRAMIWHIYHARSHTTYWRRYRDFLAFAREHLKGEALKAVNRFEKKRAELYKGWLYPGAHRVSTMLERHMQPMTRCLYMGRDFHGHRNTAHLLIRGWTLLHNFLPYCPRARSPRTREQAASPYISPFQKLNQKQYHDCWLQNLLVATSCQHEYFHQKR